MSFAEKKGITVASGFKLQAEAPIDARYVVDTIAERDELVTIRAAYDGLDVFVKETGKKYMWDGSQWEENVTGTAYTHPTTPGYQHLPAGGTAGQVLKNNGNGTGQWADETDYTEEFNGKVPVSRKVNGKALTADITLSAADTGAIPATSKGSAGGVAELDNTGKVPAAQLPSYVDDVIEGYLNAGKFYKEAAHTTEIAGESGKIYVDLQTEKTYRWSGTTYVVISDTIALGETASSAYRGDRGKTAYDHSQAAHAPANAEPNVQSDWNVNDTSSDAYIKNKPESLPADGGNADTVGGHTVEADVPAGAKFTDTVYQHPASHAASMITQDATHRFVSDAEKTAWSGKANVYFGSDLPDTAPAGSLCFLVV
ncbi:hypothetical protein BRYFOR_07634 [Marvinbryantia formatexigens DSM 14469]|uniref:Uncharacterized protein n=1 Tax=Marvinbryantia formatexigens DSM 14469 TaxID=478749 RepID=C6LG74_9FIRM|nr:hypothetical protein [Marvinbryantia formatexigens]EET60438.1 hypothetical protein BRYFOR_07634 [Marvinbryantia formatexigens DSM 14469]UWO25223.1 hypothetical protein NQ534_01665 [Marvinbryantia formatexigens DSM 14469]SDH05439.1 hypothetical protein SAMN05660368_03765 [Marvinbryantia formatexigens]